MMTVTEKKNCRACGSWLELAPVFSLGDQKLAGYYMTTGNEPRPESAPLDMMVCTNQDCQLLQLRYTVDPDTLYRKFWYRSGINPQMRMALQDVVLEATKRVANKSNLWACDIGSNDGTLLSLYNREIVKVVGFEPAVELANESRVTLQRPVGSSWYTAQVFSDYFNADDAIEASAGLGFDIITAIAMFYDLDNPKEFLLDVNRSLKDEGLFIIQMNYLELMLRNMSFDNISHEHLCYYSIKSMDLMCKEAGLCIVDAETNNVNGGSIRLYIKKKRASQVWATTARLHNLMDIEEKHNLRLAYSVFAERVKNNSAKLAAFIETISKHYKKRVYAYGASTRGSTLLQTMYPGKSSHSILGVAERDVNKYGRRMAALDLPIHAEGYVRREADYMLLLPYHFWESISHREQDWMKFGGRFIIPVPYPKVMAWDASLRAIVPFDLEQELVWLASPKSVEKKQP